MSAAYSQHAEKERADFSGRLWQALRSANQPTRATDLSRAFNKQCTGRAITVGTARKWLMGEAIPGQEKVQTLADWLKVTPEWLRFGTQPNADAQLLAELRNADPQTQAAVRDLLRQGITKGVE